MNNLTEKKKEKSCATCMRNVCISSRQTSASRERLHSFTQSLLFFMGCYGDELWRIALRAHGREERQNSGM